MRTKWQKEDSLHPDFMERFTTACREAGLPLKQDELGPAIGVTGGMAWNYLRGMKLPSMERAIIIAEKTNVCVEWLMTGRGPKYPNVVLTIEHPDDIATLIMENPSTYAAILSELQKRDPDLLCLHDVPEKHKPTLKTAIHALEKPEDDGGDLAQCA